MFRKIRPNNLDKINRLQSMKKLPIGAMGERDSRINKLINKPLKEKLKYEAQKLNFIKKGSRGFLAL